jgi:hypothetical protein
MKVMTTIMVVYGFMVDVPALPISILLGIMFILFVTRKEKK